MPDSALPEALRDEVARLGSADIMVGIPSFKNAATIGYVVRAAQAGLVQYFADLQPVLVNADAGSPDGTQRVVVETEPPDYVERILAKPGSDDSADVDDVHARPGGEFERELGRGYRHQIRIKDSTSALYGPTGPDGL